jgi:hypothetical protein
VLVVDGGGSLKRSLLGGDLAGKAAANGWAGVIVNGAVRDVAELEAEALGVLALALIPMKTEKRDLGVRGVPVTLRALSCAAATGFMLTVTASSSPPSRCICKSETKGAPHERRTRRPSHPGPDEARF